MNNSNKKIGISKDTIRSLGIAFLDPAEEELFHEYVTEELDINVGTEISKGLTKEQLIEFDNLTEQDEARQWLEVNRPTFKVIVDDQIILMKLRLMRIGKTVSTAIGDHADIRPVPIDELDLSIRCRNALKRNGIISIGELIDLPPNELSQIKNLSRYCQDELEAKLKNKYNYQLVR